MNLNLKEKKENLIKEFNELQQMAQEIEIRKQRILGQLELLEVLEREENQEKPKQEKPKK